MRKYLSNLAVMLAGATLLASCLSNDNNNGNNQQQVTVTKGAYIINNGNSYSGIDGSLTFLDYTGSTIKAEQGVYQRGNGASLGNTPNDIIAYGDKLYIVGSGENTIFVVDKKTLKQLPNGWVSTTALLGEAEGNSPRRLTAYNGLVYFTTYGGYVAAIDTTSFSLKAKYPVGSAPEGLTFGFINNGSATTATLYVANSDYGNGNGSISSINIANGSVTEIKNEKIKNPQEIAVAGDLLYVLDWGTYDDSWNQVGNGVYLVGSNNTSLVVPGATGMTAAGYVIYTFNDTYGSSDGPTFSMLDIRTNAVSNLNLNAASTHRILSPAAIAVDPNTGNLLVASRSENPDAPGTASFTLPGYVNVYSASGTFVESFATGVEPHKIEFSYGQTTITY